MVKNFLYKIELNKKLLIIKSKIYSNLAVFNKTNFF